MAHVPQWLDGSFDAGYLLVFRVDTVLRGVVFDPEISVPISNANDIAPNVNLTRRDENILLSSELPPSIQNTVAMPSTPIPLLPTMVLVVNSQGTTSVSIPDQTARLVQVGSNQTRVVLGQQNGIPLLKVSCISLNCALTSFLQVCTFSSFNLWYDAVNGGGYVWINERRFKILRKLGEGWFA
jgi:hypothetical protein